MIHVECRECRRLWEQPCRDCAEWKADRHQRATGHTDIHIRELTRTEQLFGPNPAFPEWMTKGGNS